jgi:hypothetical protein
MGREGDRTLEAALADASAFSTMLPGDVSPARISASEDGWVAIEWERRVRVEFPGDGTYGHAIWRNGRYEPGACPGRLGTLPGDIADALGGKRKPT